MQTSVLISILAVVWFFEKVDHAEASRIHGWGRVSVQQVPPACMATSRKGRRKPPSGGFGTSSVETNQNEKAPAPPKRRIYSMPALYDLAFGYRNYEEEVDFLIGQHQALHEGKPPSRTLELAAGPARHSICALQSSQVQAATAVDNSPEMVDYGRDIALHELDVDSQESFTYATEDMSDFDFEQLAGDGDVNGDLLFDSAWILLGSLQHLTTNEKVMSCFESIHRALSPRGTLIIELPHPRETFSLVECTRNGWEVPLEDEDGETSGELEIVWGDDNDAFDPITQVRQFTVSLELKGVQNADPDLQSVREIVPLRHFTSQEIDALARLTGFEVTSLHGALSEGVDVNDEDQAFRLVCVLQKLA
jgi:SAM-dependent methyltransferase